MLKKILAIILSIYSIRVSRKKCSISEYKMGNLWNCVAIQVSKFNSVELNIEKSNIAKHVQ
jgi:hypothetical protein